MLKIGEFSCGLATPCSKVVGFLFCGHTGTNSQWYEKSTVPIIYGTNSPWYEWPTYGRNGPWYE